MPGTTDENNHTLPRLYSVTEAMRAAGYTSPQTVKNHCARDPSLLAGIHGGRRLIWADRFDALVIELRKKPRRGRPPTPRPEPQEAGQGASADVAV